MKINKYIFGVLVGFLCTVNVNAAKLTFDGDRSIKYNEEGTVDIKLDTEGEDISRVEFTLTYDTNYINLKLTDEQYGLKREESGNKVMLLPASAEKMEDKVVATINVKNIRAEASTANLKLTNVKFNNSVSGADVERSFDLRYTTTTTTQKPKNTSAKLTSVTTSAGTISPEFKSSVKDYKIKGIKDTIQNITLRGACEEEGCVVEATCTSNCTAKGTKITLAQGKNEVTLEVTSEDTKNKEKYNFIVYRGETTDNSPYLSSLMIEGNPLKEKFTKDTLDYTAEVNYETENINILATPEDENATVNIKGGDKLVVGENVITITVTSSETKDKKIYNITVTRKDFEPNSSTTTKSLIAPTDEPKDTKKSNTLLIIIISVVGATIIGLAAFFIFRKPKDKKPNDKNKPELADDMPALKTDADPKEENLDIKDNELEEDLNNIESPSGSEIDAALLDLMETKQLEVTKELKL